MRSAGAAATAGATPLMLLFIAMMPACQAGWVFFPGPSIGPAPPSLWQSIHTIRQARRLGGEDGGAPELRAAGVRIGQKYSDLDEPPLLEPQQQDGGRQPLREGDSEHLQPLEPLDDLETVEIPGHINIQEEDDPRFLKDNGVQRQQNSDSPQGLAPLPFLLAAEPRGAESSTNAYAPDSGAPVSNSIIENQHPAEFVSFDDGHSAHGAPDDGYSAPDVGDIISLDEASDISQPAFVTGEIPEGVVYAVPDVENLRFNGESPDELQSSASILDLTSVKKPDQRPSFRHPQHQGQQRPAAIVAEGPLPSDQNLLNLLVTQGVLRPVGRVRVAQLRLASDDEEKEATEQGAFIAPAGSDDGEVIVELDNDGETSQVGLDARRRYREGQSNTNWQKVSGERQQPEHGAQATNEEGWQNPTETSEEQERVLSTNIVPILSEREVFDRLVTPRASSSSTITVSDLIAESGDGPVDADRTMEDAVGRHQTAEARGPDSLAARLTELGSRVSRHGVWGRRLLGAAPRGRAEAEDGGEQDGPQGPRPGGWERRIDVGEPVFVDKDGSEEAEDLDTEGSERHEEVALLEQEEIALNEESVAFDEEASEREDEVVEMAGEKGEKSERPEAVAGVDEIGNSPRITPSQIASSDILTDRTTSFRADNSTEERELTWEP